MRTGLRPDLGMFMTRQQIAPRNEAEIADAVRAAAEGRTPLEIISGGTKRDLGRPTKADTILDVSAISGILKYEPEELVLTVRAGTKLAEIDAALGEKKQMLGFAPADWGPLFGSAGGRATLAGIVATNACGSRKVKAGAVRDHVIGCRFVNGSGEAIKAGGFVIKNVTGFDLPKLMCGAFGTLGVLTELTVRVSPAPNAWRRWRFWTATPRRGCARCVRRQGWRWMPAGWLIFRPKRWHVPRCSMRTVRGSPSSA